ncbi:Methyltransferase domain-containing protein [Actinopolymorpha cephalotaxi]|uniref:Methyltransferase domain-containing protein n=1 Tax=Actinopolymorpha cephalotaxi TaxID=504797 RepID=A0A1I2K4Y4_9ACTN|nr:class I SAM-dependent methyltransferase [Actinopolymorpha cephalotaxi]NYH85981.1 SAM-dependent methyltransferase [Actinopolymorpha cephalotaxi]SFF61399.1 Methyltransferase domain-containing protein [Actinopolymorpha cephalotaxi]
MTDVEAPHLHVTRTAYDTVAADYAELLRDELAGKPVERAMLAAFAELVRSDGGGPVGDLGCGPGRVTGHLAGLGLDAFGVDLSPGMLAQARRDHPGLRFAEGTITALDLPDAELAGALGWYSVIHTPPAEQGAVFAEFARVLRPGGRLLLGFQVGEDQRIRRERAQAYGHEVTYDIYRLSPDRVIRDLRDNGFALHARVVREPEDREPTPQCFVLATRA